MDFTALQTEFFARGFDYLNDAGAGLVRAKRWLNDAYHEVNEAEDWPYLQVDVAGAAPLTIADARKVLAVRQGAVLLTEVEQRWIHEVFGDTTTAGTPEYFWLDQSAGTIIARVFPTNVASLNVRYLKFPADLSAGADVAVVPVRYHELIVHGAVRRGYLDQDNFAAAQSVQQELVAGSPRCGARSSATCRCAISAPPN
jgi:hypothetical protein